MPRTLVLLVSALLLMAVSAGPAFAQRDPFEPVIDSGVVAPGEEPAPQVTTEPNAAPQPEPLANTGLAGTSWLALAYALLALGLGVTVIGRIAGTRER